MESTLSAGDETSTWDDGAEAAAAPPGLAPQAYPGVVGAFSEVAERISSLESLDELLHLVATKICELLAVDRCSVYLKDEKSGLFRGQVAETGDDDDEAIKRLTAGGRGDGFTRQILTERKPVLLLNAQTDPRPVRSTMRAWGVQTMLGVPMVLKDEVTGILFVDNADRPHSYSDADQAIAGAFGNLAAIAISQARLTNELRSSLKTVAKQNGIMRRAQELDDQLAKLIIDGADLHTIIASVAKLTGKACAVHDAEFNQLAAAPAPSGEAEILPRILEPDYRNHLEVQEGLAGLKEKHTGVIGPLRSAGLSHRFMLTPVIVGGVESGYLVLMEYPSRFSALDLAVIRRTGTIVALAFSASERAAEADIHARNALVRDLLLGTDSAESLSRRAALLGLPLQRQFIVVLFRRKDLSRSQPASADEVARLLDDGGSRECGPYVAQVSDGVAAILPLEEGFPTAIHATESVRETVDRVAAGIAPDGDAIVAISSPVTGLTNFSETYLEVLEVAKCATLFGTPGESVQTLSAAELGPARVFMSSSNRKDLERFAAQVLGELLDSEDEHHRDLLETLDAFFRAGQRVRSAAKALDVHQNTVRYRIGKVEEMTGLDLANEPKDQLSCQLALEVARLRQLRVSAP